jgi:hypothetical protein
MAEKAVGLSATIFCFLKKKTKGFSLQSLTRKIITGFQNGLGIKI